MANAYGNRHMIRHSRTQVRDVQLMNHRHQFFGSLLALLCIDSGHKNQKFIPAVAKAEIEIRFPLTQRLADLAQDIIALNMAISVVVLFETVNIDHQ
ncbi:Uncharacterised protein [Vibrio cholerae]|nr:Uncharacterised protein [Vibrio cholerae]